MNNIFKIVLLYILSILISGCQTTGGGQSTWITRANVQSDYTTCKNQVCANNDCGGQVMFGPAILVLPLSIAMHAGRASVADQVNICTIKKGNTLRIVNNEEEGSGMDIIYLTPLYSGFEQHRLAAAAEVFCGRKVIFISDKAENDFRRVSYRCE